MPARCCSARPTARSAWSSGSPTCFADGRNAARIEHAVTTMVGQRVIGIALGYEDLVDHDQLRHDPVMAILAGKLEARRTACAPLAGKSTLNRLEHAPPAPTGTARSVTTLPRSSGCSSSFFLDAHRSPPQADRARPRCDRRPAARPSGRPVLPRLLWLLLLPAALRVLRPAPARGQAQALEHRCCRRCDRGGRADRQSDPRSIGRGCGSCCAPTAASPARP